jgi:hypothetical protein
MVNPNNCIWGVNIKIILRISKNTPMLIRENKKTAKPKRNLKVVSIYFEII